MTTRPITLEDAQRFLRANRGRIQRFPNLTEEENAYMDSLEMLAGAWLFDHPEEPKPRYSVCIFPALDGDAWRTNNFLRARWWFFLRTMSCFVTSRPFEVRLIDSETGKHWVH